jgi:hypothetical protein
LRPYLLIHPSETAIELDAAVTGMRQLHTLLFSRTKTGFLAALLGRIRVPTVEFQLATDGRPDSSVRYLVGTKDPDLTDDLRGLLGTCVPDTYEFDGVEWHPRLVEESLPLPAPDEAGEGNPYVAGVEYVARAERKRDWQTSLKPFDTTPQSPNYSRSTPHRSHLAPVVEVLTEATMPVLFQVVLAPKADWATSADMYVQDLQRDTTTRSLLGFPKPRPTQETADYTPPPSHQDRIDSIRRRFQDRSFTLTARAVVLTRDHPEEADRIARRLESALEPISGQHHQIVGRVATDSSGGIIRNSDPGSQIYQDLIDRRLERPSYESGTSRLPLISHTSQGIVIDSREVPSLTLVDGDGLAASGTRAIGARPEERTTLRLPPPGQLATYRPPGMALCMPLTHDRHPSGEPLYLPPEIQQRHVLVVGETGAGKSVLLERAILTNADATDGPDVLFDSKGGDTATNYLRAHFAAHGDFEDVYYFDLSQTLPALSFFDISPLLEAGVPREEARSRKAGHYQELLAGLMGPEQYGQAAESVKAVRNHLRALYDPVNGDDAFAHEDLYAALLRTQDDESPPATADDRLASYFDSLLLRDRDIFNAILGGAVGRVETIATDGRLAPVFDHVPTDHGPHFDFADILDDDVTIIFDFAGLEDKVKRALTIVILSNLWTALKARNQDSSQDHPLVNCYLEEARNVAETRLLDTLLAEGRAFGLSLTLGLQYPEQVISPDPDRDTYKEVLNETATFVAGPVAVDAELPGVFATDSIPPEKMARRLNALGRGEWLVRPGAGFGEDAVQPFVATSLPAPSGHPASDEPLSNDEERQFASALAACYERTAGQMGIEHGTFDGSATEAIDPDIRLDSLLPHTNQIPEGVTYLAGPHALECDTCEGRYAPTSDGMRDAIECHGSLDAVDRDDIPVCRLDLKRSPTEIEASEWSLTQLCFLQVVYNAWSRRYDPLEYDLVRDSMRRLKGYVDIDDNAVDELIDAGLLRHDTNQPQQLYSVTPDGRDAIGESHRAGIDFGHGRGDLNESTEHVFGVKLGARLLEKEYVQDDESEVESVQPYYDLRRDKVDGESLDEHTEIAELSRLDVAGLDDGGNVIVAIEVERINSGSRSTTPDDYDKLAACDPTEAIWIVPNKDAGQTVFDSLRNPKDGEPRFEREHPPVNSPPEEHDKDQPGMNAIYTYAWLKVRLLAD